MDKACPRDINRFIISVYNNVLVSEVPRVLNLLLHRSKAQVDCKSFAI